MIITYIQNSSVYCTESMFFTKANDAQLYTLICKKLGLASIFHFLNHFLQLTTSCNLAYNPTTSCTF